MQANAVIGHIFLFVFCKANFLTVYPIHLYREFGNRVAKLFDVRGGP